ncbi:hypothetical protein CEUSTIGMA_g3192.t1 [Chlamydomonas eustigma]|uniref:Uncharacterized protein n=1 Tax=Chlamydomonas eustigma TaxID=1157962 RepID=A0A250WYH6_9CHLO|nr:hypothetical protein CEUSTIGMA_g3192.t1 [Chlamydomonas eustigma]|eukprot:GAX75749.1 hypothetical protein CEUSTIGMA_g3192.t1 [Chlamydomonas eustigma]
MLQTRKYTMHRMEEVFLKTWLITSFVPERGRDKVLMSGSTGLELQRYLRPGGHLRCLSSDSASTTQEASVNVTKMDSATLQSLASLIYSRTDLFQSYLSRSEAEVAQQLQQLIGKLDRPRRALLMQKLAAVSEKRATPFILAWTASSIMKEIAQLSKSDPTSLSTFYPHLVSIAKTLASASGDLAASKSKTENDLVAWLLKPTGSLLTWDLLLQMPCMEQLLETACKVNAKVALASNVLGVFNPGLVEESLQGGQSHVAYILGQLHVSSRQKLTAITDSTSSPPQFPIDFVAKARAKIQGMDSQAPSSPSTTPSPLSGGLPSNDNATTSPIAQSDAVPTADYDPAVKEGIVGLALYKWLNLKLGLELNPDVQLVNRLLHTSPFEVMLPQGLESRDGNEADGGSEAVTSALSCLSHDLLHSTVQHLSALPNLSAADLLAELDSSVSSVKSFEAAMMAAGGDSNNIGDPNPSRAVLHAVHTWRREALLQGVPCIMATASAGELAALSNEQVLRVQNAAQRLETSWRLLEGLIKPGYDGKLGIYLAQLQALPQDNRLALAWGLRKPEAAHAIRPLLLSAFYSSTVHRYHSHQGEVSKYEALVQAFTLERYTAELDVMGDGVSAALNQTGLALSQSDLSRPEKLPLESFLIKSQKKSADNVQELNLLLENGSESVSEAGVLASFEALIQGLEGEEDQPKEIEKVPATLREWFAAAKLSVNRLSPSMLSLLRRFLALKIRVSKSDALESQQKSRLLLGAVQAEIKRADRVARGSLASPSSVSPPSPYWVSIDVSSQRKDKVGGSSSSFMTGVMSSSSSGTVHTIDPDIVRTLLDNPDSREFNEWLQSTALLQSQPFSQQPYKLLAEKHLEMDLDRYLKMRHDPELSISFKTPPRAWREAGRVGLGTETDFIEGMKAGLDSFLAAKGMEPTGEMEWEVYKEHALAEFSVLREAHEDALREAGHSCFFNSRAEAMFLRSWMESSIPSSSPIHDQAFTYLETLEGNSSWSFAQKKIAVQRLIKLSQHFSMQTDVLERGSPFAPLFSPDKPKPLTPNLKPIRNEVKDKDVFPTNF